MRFTHEGSEYLIEFERSSKVPAESIVGIPRVYTMAKILKVTGPEKTDRTVVRSYEVGACHRDRFSYEAGRKIALARAMYDAPISRPVGDGTKSQLGDNRLTKEFRTAVWTAYHTRVGGLLG